MTELSPPADQRSRVLVNAALYFLVLAALTLVVVFTVKAVQQDDAPGSGTSSAGAVQEDASGEPLESAVIDAASAEVLAFMNVDYHDVDKTTDAVLAGATGQFAKEYEKTVEGLRRLVTRNKSVMNARILAAGVVDANEEIAHVLVAASGSGSNVNTGDKPQSREWRVQVELKYVDGQWLTSDLQFVS